MPISPEPAQPVVDPVAADQGTMVDLGLADPQPTPPDPEPSGGDGGSEPTDPPTDPGNDTPSA